MKNFKICLLIGIIFFIIILLFLFFAPKELSKEQLAVSRLRDIHVGLRQYESEYGEFPNSLTDLLNSNILYEQINYEEFIKNTHYLYFDNKKNSSFIFHNAPGYSSPLDKNSKIWFYYPLEDGKAIVGFEGVTVGYLKQKDLNSKSVDKQSAQNKAKDQHKPTPSTNPSNPQTQ